MPRKNSGNRQQYVTECQQKVQNLFKQRRMLIQYVEKGDKKVGVLVAVKDGDQVSFGWSKYNVAHETAHFDRYVGIWKACSRQLDEHSLLNDKEIPQVIRKDAELVINRAKRYFKDVNFDAALAK